MSGDVCNHLLRTDDDELQWLMSDDDDELRWLTSGECGACNDLLPSDDELQWQQTDGDDDRSLKHWGRWNR